MAIPAGLQTLLKKYMDNVKGSDSEKQQKRAALQALTATTRKDFIKQASQFVQDTNGNCEPGWFMCADGSCAPSKQDCSGLGGESNKP